MAEGDRFEMARVRALLEEHGEDRVYLHGVVDEGTVRRRRRPPRSPRLADLLRQPDAAPVRRPARGRPLARRPRRRRGVPPLRRARPRRRRAPPVALRPPRGRRARRGGRAPSAPRLGLQGEPEGEARALRPGRLLLLLLEHALDALGLAATARYAVDTEAGVDPLEAGGARGVRARALPPGRPERPPQPGPRASSPRRPPRPTTTSARSASSASTSTTCERRGRRDTDDLSRVPYISSESKRRLSEAGITTCADLAALSDPDERREASTTLRERGHDLSVHLTRYVAAARGARRRGCPARSTRRRSPSPPTRTSASSSRPSRTA